MGARRLGRLPCRNRPRDAWLNGSRKVDGPRDLGEARRRVRPILGEIEQLPEGGRDLLVGRERRHQGAEREAALHDEIAADQEEEERREVGRVIVQALDAALHVVDGDAEPLKLLDVRHVAPQRRGGCIALRRGRGEARTPGDLGRGDEGAQRPRGEDALPDLRVQTPLEARQDRKLHRQHDQRGEGKGDVLEQEEGDSDRAGTLFDALAVDAFSGDAIPTHLLTAEALDVYFKRLKPDGVLLVHTTNRYLDLPPVVKVLADGRGLASAIIENVPTDEESAMQQSDSDWVVVARNRNVLDIPSVAARAAAITPRPAVTPWTDDYNNLLHILK